MSSKLLFVIFFVLNSAIMKSQGLQLHIKIDSISNVYPDKHLLFGSIRFINNTKKTLKIPKTFDLGITVFDQKGQQLKPNFQSNREYHNLLVFKKKMKILSDEDLVIDFCEWRLFLFNLIDGNNYLLQYELNSSNYDEFQKVFGDNLFLSNREKFSFKVTTEKK